MIHDFWCGYTIRMGDGIISRFGFVFVQPNIPLMGLFFRGTVCRKPWSSFSVYSIHIGFAIYIYTSTPIDALKTGQNIPCKLGITCIIIMCHLFQTSKLSHSPTDLPFCIGLLLPLAVSHPSFLFAARHRPETAPFDVPARCATRHPGWETIGNPCERRAATGVGNLGNSTEAQNA